MSIATAEIRLKAIQAYKSGKGTQRHIADLYGVHVNTLKNWQTMIRKTAFLPDPEAICVRLYDMVMEKNDMTLKEMREKLNNKCSIMAIWHEFNRQGLRLKKNSKSKRTK